VQPPPELGRFQVVRELGRGGMGVVYEVRDPALGGRALALKLLQATSDANALLRFAREAEVLARVRHVGVVRVHALERTPRGEPYLLTDLVPGRDLAAHVKAMGRPTPAAAAALVRDVADAMAAVHAAGVVHRDLKPANVLIRPDGAPVVIDFGLARAEEASRLTATGTVMGTVAFMPPEQAEGKVVDARADVYGLGAILYWLLTERAPFGGPPVQAMFALLHKEPPWPLELEPTVPRGLDALCRRAMAKDPADRPADAAALRDALTRWLAEGEPATRPRRGRAIAGALVALAGCVALGLAVRSASVEGPLVPAPPTTERASSAVAADDSATPATAESLPAPPIVAVDPAWRRTWGGGTWDEEPGSDLLVRFLDDERLVTLPDGQNRVTVHSITPDFPERRPSRFAVDDRGMSIARGATGEVLFVTQSSLWTLGAEQPRWVWSPDAHANEALAFEPATRRAVVSGRDLGLTLLSVAGATAQVVDTLELDGAGLPYGLGFCQGRVVLARRLTSGGSELVVWSPGTPSHVEGLPGVASLAVHADRPLVAVGLKNGGRIVLFDLSGPELVERMVLQLDWSLLPAAGTQIWACAFSRTHLWACTPSGLWRWPLERGAVRPEHDAFHDVPADFGSPTSIDVSPDGALVAVGGRGKVMVRGVDAP
jgi:predicted Ser/Thr protein kinase